MRHRLTENVKLLQKVVIDSQDKVLLLKRADNAYYRAGKWDLPGGNAEWPARVDHDLRDPHFDDVVREVEEETSIRIEPERFNTRPIYFGSFFEMEKNIYALIVGWQVHLDQLPSVKISHEHSQYRWVSTNELRKYDFGFAGQPDGFIEKIWQQWYRLSKDRE